MFIGHYGLAFMIKKKFREIPLWFVFLTVQLTDIVAFILVFLGLERAVYRQSANPFFRNDLDLPYSHSLIGSILLAGILYAILILAKQKSWALIGALGVLSHWLIDFIVHTPDLSLFFGYMKTGLGLWNYPTLSFGIEIILVCAGWLILGYRNGASFLLLFLLLGSFSGMFFGREPEAIKNSQVIRTAIVLIPTLLFIGLAYVSERNERKKRRGERI
jgi:hypothetical protein